MNIIQRWFIVVLFALAASALAGGGASSARVRHEVLAPHVMLEESRLWKLPGFTTELAQQTVAAGFHLAPGAELPWDTLRGIHAKGLIVDTRPPDMHQVIVILRFAERTLPTAPLSRAQAGDVIYCSAYLAGWDVDRVRQTTVPGSVPPTNSAPVLRPKHPIPYSPELAQKGQRISASNPPALTLQPADPLPPP